MKKFAWKREEALFSSLKPSHRVFMQISKTFVAFNLCSMCFGFVYPGGKKTELKSWGTREDPRGPYLPTAEICMKMQGHCFSSLEALLSL